MTQESRPVSWWHTVPGTLTAIAAVITALTGFLFALGELGLIGGGGGAPAVQAAGAAGSAEPAAPSPGAGSGEVPASAGAAVPTLEASVRAAALGDYKYEFLELRTEPRNPGEYVLRLHVRMLNETAYDANFWASTFRLRVDGIPRAPDPGLNEVVSGRGAKEGMVEFVVPAGASSLVLVLHSSTESVEIPLVRAG